jgi:hypothetical protein
MEENDENQQDVLLFKGLRRQVRRRDLGEPSPMQKQLAAVRERQEKERADELADAMNSPYYWWWVFVRESQEYRDVVGGQKVDRTIAALAKDFGDLRSADFERWWFKTGRYLFSQKKPEVKTLQDGVVIRDSEKKQCLYLEVPLRMRRVTALRKINKILGEHFKGDDGGRHNVYARSQAKREVNKSSKIRPRTFQQFYDVWMDRKRDPESPWWETGEKLNISAAYKNFPYTPKGDWLDNNRNMTLTVQRIYRKTQKLIYWAARGEFPRVK